MVGPHWKNEDFIQIHKLFFNPFPLYDVGKMDAILRGHAALPGTSYIYTGIKYRQPQVQTFEHVFNYFTL